MSDGKTQLLVANPLKRHLLNSTTLKSYKYGPDGSLTLYISYDDPGPAKHPTGCLRQTADSTASSASTWPETSWSTAHGRSRRCNQ
jgi:hypothetical protein